MKQLLILSGKGGTGKTTIAGAFIKLNRTKAYADCDVDAPNLHLLMTDGALSRHTTYYGLPKAQIDAQLCNGCGMCRELCRFDAISADRVYRVEPMACEGCGVCALICPVGAVSLAPYVDGDLLLYNTSSAIFSTALLKMGSGTSGMLVTAVKKQLLEAVDDVDVVIIDGSPGIGCPVIASISGVDMVLVVAEPSISGISDMERIVRTAAGFHVKTAVCINKYDMNMANTEQIECYCRNEGLPCTGRIPFDPTVITALNDGRAITDTACPAGSAIREVYVNTMQLLFEQNDEEQR